MVAKSVNIKVGSIWKHRGPSYRVRLVKVDGNYITMELMDKVRGYPIGYQYNDYSMNNYDLISVKKESVIPWL